MKSGYDIISIGDCTIDAFVEVEEATATCDINHEHCQLSFSFADKIPYKSLNMLSAGNSNNIAVGMARLGLKSGFYGTVGKDPNGKIILDTLKSEGVDTKFMSVQDKPTNFHIVLVHKGERTILIKHQDYAYKLPAGINKAEWLYYSTVGPKGLAMQKAVVEMVKKNPGIKLVFNPGTYQLRMGLKKLAPMLKESEILFVNKEEARMLLGTEDQHRELAEKLQKYGPKIVVITDGLKGAYALDKDGEFYFVGIYPHKVAEATGCGDAFATGFTGALIYGLPITEALRWGGRNGAAVATKIGPQAGLLTKKTMVSDLKKYPTFKPKKVK